MKQILGSHSEVAHVWASRSQESGEASRVFFDGDTIYSYGRHFPIARFQKMPNGQEVVMFTANDYSVSTSKHKNYVRRAIPDNYTVVVMPSSLWSCYASGKAYLIDEIKNSLQLSSTANKHAWFNVREAVRAINCLKQWAELHKRKAKYKFTKTDKAIVKRALKFKRKYAVAEAKRYKEHQEQIAKDKQLLADVCGGDIAKFWHTYGHIPDYESVGSISLYDLPCMVRMSTDNTEVITSQGARVPAEHAKRLFPIILRARRTKKAYTIPPMEPVRIGHYTLREISENGDITIGCHNILWPEVEYIGKELKVL